MVRLRRRALRQRRRTHWSGPATPRVAPRPPHHPLRMPAPPPVGAAELDEALRRVSGKKSPTADGWQLCHLKTWPSALVEAPSEFCRRTGRALAAGVCP